MRLKVKYLPSALLSRGTPEEARSYSFFIEVTAPSIAGSFNAAFWKEQVPQACLNDPALWHAIVSLGSVHEKHATHRLGRSKEQPERNTFALQQFNAAVTKLVEANKAGREEKWRALSISTVFTCICILEGLFQQANMHFRAGCSIMNEILEEDRERMAQGHSPHPNPVSVKSIQSIISDLMIKSRMSYHNASEEVSSIVPTSEGFSLWKIYEAPRKSSRSVTKENMRQATGAAESLLNAIVLLLGISEHGRVCGLPPPVQFEERKAALSRCHEEIRVAIEGFSAELESSTAKCTGDWQLSLLFTRLYHAANQFLILRLDANGEIPATTRTLGACWLTIDYAEKILNLEDALETRSNGMHLTPRPPISPPLCMVASVAPSKHCRKEAIALLRRPRLEGYLDSIISASVVEAVTIREEEATKEYRQMESDGDGVASDDPRLKYGVVDDPMRDARIYDIDFSFTGRRTAVLTLLTVREFREGRKGKKANINW